MTKKILFAAVILTFLLSFCTVFADQDGRNCWCNIDQYGCWITDEDGGKIYIMFWTEEARQYIMGTHSAPYKLVVAQPGFSGTLPLECMIVTAAPASEPDPTPSDPQCEEDLAVCKQFCDRSDCALSETPANCVDKDTCYQDCVRDFNLCSAQ